MSRCLGMTPRRPRDSNFCQQTQFLVPRYHTAFYAECRPGVAAFIVNRFQGIVRPFNSPKICQAMPSITPIKMSCSRRAFFTVLSRVTWSALVSSAVPISAARAARPEGVNRPDLLPAEYTTIIDLERFLASGERRRLISRIENVENQTGYKIRLLTQRYPQSPGLAVRKYWSIDANTILIVADYFGGSGQLLKFNVGRNIDRILPPRFWSVLSANYGNKFYVSKNGEAVSIINAVEAICACLLKGGCATPPTSTPAPRKSMFGRS